MTIRRIITVALVTMGTMFAANMAAGMHPALARLLKGSQPQTTNA